jgi:hypothetical protein
VIDVSMKVTIDGRIVEISDGYESPPALWADNDHEAAVALLFQLLEQMCTALDTEFVCPPSGEHTPETPSDATVSINEDVQHLQALLLETAYETQFGYHTQQGPYPNIARTLDDQRIPTHHVVIQPSADDAFNRPAHIVELQDGDIDG